MKRVFNKKWLKTWKRLPKNVTYYVSRDPAVTGSDCSTMVALDPKTGVIYIIGEILKGKLYYAKAKTISSN